MNSSGESASRLATPRSRPSAPSQTRIDMSRHQRHSRRWRSTRFLTALAQSRNCSTDSDVSNVTAKSLRGLEARMRRAICERICRGRSGSQGQVVGDDGSLAYTYLFADRLNTTRSVDANFPRPP